MTSKPQNVTKTTLHGDAGQAAQAMAKAIFDFNGHTGHPPTMLVIGVDLYERLVVNGAHVSPKNEWAYMFGYSDRWLVAVSYPDTFMGVPLAIVPDKGMVRAIGAPNDMLMMYGGKREGGAQP